MRTVLAICVAALLAGCGASSGGNGRTKVIAAFYPVAFAAEQVGGGAVDVENLTPPGAEPHDIELAPGEVADLQRGDVVLYFSHGFQPAIERAVKDASGKKVDLLEGMDLRAEGNETDPHVWLDPSRYAAIVRRVAAALGRTAQAKPLTQRVLQLDRDFRKGLAQCDRREFVTSHAAFGYLAARYGLTQIPITGIDPESEPSARSLARLAGLVRGRHIGTVFFERLVSPRLAQTVAREAGAETAVLDPIEGLTPAEERDGDTYLTLMRRNLEALRRALGCR